MDSLVGISAGDLWKLLCRNRFEVDAPYWGRVAWLTVMSLATSRDRRREIRRHAPEWEKERAHPPVFVLGHYRSGTSLLHNLLVQDDRFAFANMVQVSHPHTFLIREPQAAKALRDAPPVKRPMDNMEVRFDSPGEDEWALETMTLTSPLCGWVFPRRIASYERYLTFDGAEPEELEAWKAALSTFIKKLTLRWRRPIILKSPPHTARIRLLLELFPGARFVHIRRNPYTVFRSNQRLWDSVIPYTCLQRIPPGDVLDGAILRQYGATYDAFFEQNGLIPEGRFCEVSFEELEQDMEGRVEEVYRRLGLPDFEAVRPKLQRYIGTLGGYRKNVFHPLEEPLRGRVHERLRRCFEEWGYPA